MHSVTSYHSSRYHYGVVARYAMHPSYYGGAHWAYYGGHHWYDGYWYNYWANQDWMWWGGYFGFWLDLDGIDVFVYESSPGVCEYWNGFMWVGWYNPPWTPYYCPY